MNKNKSMSKRILAQHLSPRRSKIYINSYKVDSAVTGFFNLLSECELFSCIALTVLFFLSFLIVHYPILAWESQSGLCCIKWLCRKQHKERRNHEFNKFKLNSWHSGRPCYGIAHLVALTCRETRAHNPVNRACSLSWKTSHVSGELANS